MNPANQNLQPSQWLLDFLITYERFRPTAYKPTPTDKWTCGYGHTDSVAPNTVCDMATARAWLTQDIQNAVDMVKRLVNVPLTQNQFDALVSLVFNAGPEPLDKTLGALLNAGNYAGAQGQFAKWDYQAGKPVDGLEKRRIAEAAHFGLSA